MIPVEKTLIYLGIPYEVREGSDAWFLCPLHEENTPSCHIDLNTGRWRCWGCGQGGGFEDLIAKIVHDPLKALAVIHRARKYEGLLAPRGEEPSQVWTPIDPNVGWSRFQKADWMNMPKEQPVLAYLLGRGFRRDILEAFDARLTEWSEYPVAFQLHDGTSIIGYARRRIDSGKPKYRYNAGFSGDSGVAYYCADSGAACLIVEGILDLMMAAQFGYPRVAALLGWRINQGKKDKLAKLGVTKMICALDNDEMGQAGWNLMKSNYGGNVTRFEFPSYRKDVGEMKQHEFLVGLP